MSIGAVRRRLRPCGLQHRTHTGCSPTGYRSLMASFVLIPGAGSGPWLWSMVGAELERHGHDPVAVDLPCEDPQAGLEDYLAAAVAAADGHGDLLVVRQSLGAVTAVPLAARGGPR